MVSKSNIMHHHRINTWRHPSPWGSWGSCLMHKSHPTWYPPPQGWDCLTALGVETSQTFAQVSTHVSLSMYINRRRGLMQEARVRGSLSLLTLQQPSQSEQRSHQPPLPKPAPQEAHKTTAYMWDISPKSSSVQSSICLLTRWVLP